MLPEAIAWIRAEGHKLEADLRGRLLELHRPPGWLPCWFHGLWHRGVARFRKVNVIIGVEQEPAHVHATLQRHGAQVNHLQHTGHICARARVGALKDLSSTLGVSRIWLDGEVKALLDTAVPAAGAVQTVSRYSGQGVTIAVVDTGIYEHPDLAGRIIAFKDFVGKKTRPYDDNGHGTHVAGCASGDGARSGGVYKGPAPGARLVGVKVLNRVGSGTFSQLLAGVNWVIENKDRYGIRIMSMSLGGTTSGRCEDDPLCQAVGRAWQAGIVAVVAAGNEGPKGRTVSTPGISPLAVTVGAMDDHGSDNRSDDTLADFSSRGPTAEGLHKPDLLAPGVKITSLRSPRSYLDKTVASARVGSWYFTLSGTSMATPIVSGIVALLLQARPGLTPDQVKFRLKATAQDRGLLPDEQGAGYIDADRAIQA